MKYYIGEYWAMANSTDSKTREEGKLKWNETAKEYAHYFESVKRKLPKKFLNEFDKNNWFHDFYFESIVVSNINKYESVVEFVITLNDVSYKITLKGVNGLTLDIPQTKNWMMGKLTWGYNEFELNDNNSWVIRILCDFCCEIEVLFKQIEITKA